MQSQFTLYSDAFFPLETSELALESNLPLSLLDCLSVVKLTNALALVIKDWAKYLLKCMGMVKQQANTKAKDTVEDFETLRNNSC